ncbi:hypothetical protein [Nonomuraea sp. NPDC050691]|uniref:hypothetical protein n=1 Tax=Nonomuraea sp. NPDC050691 TaxID=3155661 RepID=UPI0033FFB237
MLTSKARRRLALKTSALAAAGAGIFGVVPAVAALATPVDVVYSCTGQVGGVASNVPFQMELKTPLVQPTASATVTLTWEIRQPTATQSQLLATAAITPSSAVVAEGTVTPSGSPVPSTAVTGGATASPYATVTSNAPMPLPTMTFLVRPTATGTVAVKGGGFSLKVNGTTWYNCAPGASGGPSMNLVVGTGSPSTSSSPSPSTTPTTPTPTPSATKTTPTPKQTKTSYVTVVETPKKRSSRTPKAGANTGAGGEMGPDGRMFVLVGAALILAAGVGGLAMRRRGINKG